MNLFKKLFRQKREYEPLEEVEQEEENLTTETRKSLDVTDKLQRIKFTESCLEQMKEAVNEVNRLQSEYRLVSAYLKDMDEISALPASEKALIEEHAKAIYNLDYDREQSHARSSHMAESDYRRMERLADEADEAVKKLEEAEEYQDKIKKDLQRLEGEKHACKYRIGEAQTALLNARGMTIICLIAAVACIAILLLLELALDMETRVGYLIMAAVVAAVLMVLFLRYKEAEREYRSASQSYNKVILLQNTVKIRYVNNTGLLDYLYMKYGTDSAAAFSQLWKKYQVEKEEREKMRQTELDLDYYSGCLVKQLKNYQLFDPVIWVHQAGALLDAKEMVEVRHGLNLRRQNLRKQIDYNESNAAQAKEELMELVKAYPKYAGEILDMVSVYEKRFGL
ncbi:MAG: hypothetical protein HDR00_08395 [Lachnospiraceae bacterium]|nr:hypothetical protein [Lachnospiraceae bacterium]